MAELYRGNFADDDAWQRHVRDTFLIPFYAAQGWLYGLVDGDSALARWLQKQCGTDTFLVRTRGLEATDEKIVRWPGREYDAVFLETRSRPIDGTWRPAWMMYSQARHLLYAFAQAPGVRVLPGTKSNAVEHLDVWLIDMARLQAWFWRNERRFVLHTAIDPRTLTETEGRIVPLADIVAAGVPIERFRVEQLAVAA